MSCIVLVGGGIGCGKSTLISYLLQNKNEIFALCEEDINCKCTSKNINRDYQNNSYLKFHVIQFDNLCSIDEQKQLMKTFRGWRDFRTDLLMAAERFIAFICNSEESILGPLSERSYKLYNKLLAFNELSNSVSNAIIFVEDNFYYRSMRYDWFQVARRTNLGFATIFLHCPLNTALYRNSIRGYHIPEEKIKKMLLFIEYPDSTKYKWEKYSIKFDSSELTNSVLSEIVDVITNAAKNPAEKVIMEDKINAQKICSHNVVHQADKILRKIVSRKIIIYKNVPANEINMKFVVSNLIKIRQKLLSDIKQDCVHLPQDLREKIQTLGVESVLDIFEEELTELFNSALEECAIISNLSSLKLE